MKKILRAIRNLFVLVFMAYDEECAKAGVIDHSGQGRD